MTYNINEYFETLILSADFFDLTDKEHRFFSIEKNFNGIDINLLKNANIAIIGVPDSRESENFGCEKAVDLIREEFYKLFVHNKKIKIYDLGNLKFYKNINITYTVLADVLHFLLANNIIPLIIGGTQNITYSQYLAHVKLEKNFNITTIDACFDLANINDEFNSQSYMTKIIMERNYFLRKLTNIGYQSYLVPLYQKNIMDKLKFNAIRLGEARTYITINEPYLRDTDLFSIDIKAIRYSSAAANTTASPNGFLPEELCQLAKYAGANDRTSSFGLYEVNPKLDTHNTTVKLAAQILWHFIDGYGLRKNEYPKEDFTNYKKFIMQLDSAEELVFYCSNRSDKWWIKVKDSDNKYTIAACLHEDYKNCMNSDISPRILELFNNL